MNEFLRQLVTPSQLFTMRPNPINLSTFMMLAGFFIVFVAIAAGFFLLARRNKKDYLLNKSYNNFGANFLTIGLIGIVYSWFAYIMVHAFSNRLIFIFLILVFLVWLGFILRFHLVKIPRVKKQRKEKNEFKKYLP
ncbi:hypothetical protein KKA15_04575 [Patescibacteria group bacterium]|nr:hypothetical protein [Patescibacteria group bacterium]